MIAAAALFTAVLGIFGLPVAKSLSASGFQDPTAESSRATELLTDKFHRGDVQLLILVSAPDGVDSAAARAAGTRIVDQLRQSPHVANVTSPWTTPPAAAADLVSRDRTAGLIAAGITGNESQQQTYAKDLSEQVARDGGDVTVRSGGIAMVNVQITETSQRDLLLMESIAIPLSFLVLVWVFGGLLAAALPVAVGGMAILGALAVHFLKSFAYAGVATVAFAATAAIVVTPAALVLIGDRLDSLDVGRFAPHVLGRPEPTPVPVEQRFWFARRNAPCTVPFPSGWPVSRCSCCSARRSSACGGAFPTTGCFRRLPLHTRSATSCAKTSSTTPTPR